METVKRLFLSNLLKARAVDFKQVQVYLDNSLKNVFSLIYTKLQINY